jgi:hypothetical protein
VGALGFGGVAAADVPAEAKRLDKGTRAGFESAGAASTAWVGSGAVDTVAAEADRDAVALGPALPRDSAKLASGDDAAPAAAADTVCAGVASLGAGVLTTVGGVTGSLTTTSFRIRPTAVRMVLRAWSFATGLVRISSAPRRKAVGSPARPSTIAMGIGLWPFFPRRQTSKISLAAGRFSQSTRTRSKLCELSFWAAETPSSGRSQLTDISSKTPVIALTAWSSGDKSKASGMASLC